MSTSETKSPEPSKKTPKKTKEPTKSAPKAKVVTKKPSKSETSELAAPIRKDEEYLKKFIDDKALDDGEAMLKMEDSFTLQGKAERIKIFKPKTDKDPKLGKYYNLTKIVFDTDIVYSDAHEFCFDLKCIRSLLFEKLHEVYEFYSQDNKKVGHIVYSKTKSPNLLVSPREFLVARRSTPIDNLADYSKGFQIVTTSCEIDQYPIVSGAVRGIRYTVEQAAPSPTRKNSKDEVLTDWILIQSVDVKGFIPAWIVEKFIHKPPKQLIQSLENKYFRFSERKKAEKDGLPIPQSCINDPDDVLPTDIPADILAEIEKDNAAAAALGAPAIL